MPAGRPLGAAGALGNWFKLQQFTLSLWGKPASAQGPFADLLDNNHLSARSRVFERVNSPEPANWRWHAGADAELFFKLATNRWQHLVVSRDANGVSRLYLEGRSAGSVTNTGAVHYDGAQFLWLGRWGAGGRYFNGLADVLMAFDRPLSADEVAWLHASQGRRPRLSIQPSPGTVQLSWPLEAAGYRLEAATLLLADDWATVTNGVVSSPTHFNLSLPSEGATRFFHLHQP